MRRLTKREQRIYNVIEKLSDLDFKNCKRYETDGREEIARERLIRSAVYDEILFMFKNEEWLEKMEEIYTK